MAADPFRFRKLTLSNCGNKKEMVEVGLLTKGTLPLSSFSVACLLL